MVQCIYLGQVIIGRATCWDSVRSLTVTGMMSSGRTFQTRKAIYQRSRAWRVYARKWLLPAVYNVRLAVCTTSVCLSVCVWHHLSMWNVAAGDIAFRFVDFLRNTKSGSDTESESPATASDGHVTVCDINQAMLDVGKNKAALHGRSEWQWGACFSLSVQLVIVVC